ncbi:MAG: hypothetical protein K5739_09455 [Lachnospiraceae bacterium]|nr:hypothetical protein [Lachnospiraceae bacterium]
MASLIFESEKMKLFSELTRLCGYVGYRDDWRDRFWNDLLANPDIYAEFLYYMDHQDFLDEAKVGGYTATDFFIWEMRKYNVRTDRGKNGADCDKYAMLLETFDSMMQKKKDQSSITWSMEMRSGCDSGT